MNPAPQGAGEREKKMNNEKAVSVFMLAVAQIQEELEDLQAYVDNHLNVSPEAVNWGHVGTARHLLELVREAGVFAGIKSEEGC